MLILPVGNYTPVTPVAPVEPIVGRKTRSSEKSSGGKPGATRPARGADTLASHSARAALDEMKLGG